MATAARAARCPGSASDFGAPPSSSARAAARRPRRARRPRWPSRRADRSADRRRGALRRPSPRSGSVARPGERRVGGLERVAEVDPVDDEAALAEPLQHRPDRQRAGGADLGQRACGPGVAGRRERDDGRLLRLLGRAAAPLEQDATGRRRSRPRRRSRARSRACRRRCAPRRGRCRCGGSTCPAESGARPSRRSSRARAGATARGPPRPRRRACGPEASRSRPPRREG